MPQLWDNTKQCDDDNDDDDDGMIMIMIMIMIMTLMNICIPQLLSSQDEYKSKLKNKNNLIYNIIAPKAGSKKWAKSVWFHLTLLFGYNQIRTACVNKIKPFQNCYRLSAFCFLIWHQVDGILLNYYNLMIRYIEVENEDKKTAFISNILSLR